MKVVNPNTKWIDGHMYSMNGHKATKMFRTLVEYVQIESQTVGNRSRHQVENNNKQI